MKLEVGDVVALNMPMIGCEIGTRGVVYETYQDFDDKKKQISFFKRGFGGELHQVFRGRKFYDKEHLKKELLKHVET